MQPFTLRCDYGQLTEIERMVERYSGKITHSEYQADVALCLALPYGSVGEFEQHLSDFSRGALTLQRAE